MSGQDVLRERIARALWEHRYPGVEQTGPLADLALTDADAVVAALGLTEECREADTIEFIDFHRYVTPWERIEGDA